jgi:hypothetical protein
MILKRVKYREQTYCILGHTDILNTFLKFFIPYRFRDPTLWKPTEIINYLETYKEEQIINLNEIGDETGFMCHQCHCDDAFHSVTVINL